MSPPPLKLTILLASVREGRFGPQVAAWFQSRARQSDRFTTALLDLDAVTLPPRLPLDIAMLAHPEGRSPALRAVFDELDRSEAFVVVTPEYNHGYPASIKHLIDWHFSVWQAKPVAFVSYGGAGGGVRAVEQLRQVFAELHAVTIRDAVSFDRFWTRFDEAGRLGEGDEAETAAAGVIERLSWWALALRNARAAIPYRID